MLPAEALHPCQKRLETDLTKFQDPGISISFSGSSDSDEKKAIKRFPEEFLTNIDVSKGWLVNSSYLISPDPILVVFSKAEKTMKN
jgi:hypothetical protein